MHRGFDEIGDIVDDKQLHTWRKLLAKLRYLGSHCVGDFHRVHARLANDLYADHVLPGIVLAEERRPGAELLRAIFDLRNIAHAYRNSSPCSDYDVAELIGRSNTPQRSQAQFLRPGNHATARCLDIFSLQRIAHVEDREVMGGKLLRIEQDANLPLLAAAEVNAANAVNRLQGAANLLVGDLG